MADESRKIILQVSIDAGKSINEVIKLKDTIKQLKDEQKALDTTTEEGKKTFEAYNAQIKALTKEQKSLELAIEKTAAGFQFEEGSIAANRAELSKLTAEYKNLAKPTQEQTDRIKKLSDRLKEQEGAIGNTSRNVGNYGEALNGISGQISGIAGNITGLQGGLGAFGPILGDLTKGLKEFGSSGKKGVEDLGEGTKKGSAGFKLLAGAIAATGIALFLLAIQKLIEYFKSTEKGAELLEKVFSGIGAVVTGLIVNAETLGNIFLDLATFNFSGAAASAKELGGTLKDAAEEAVALTGRLQDLEDEEVKQSVVNAKRRNEVALLIKQSKDRTKSEGERLALLDKASEVERKGAEKEIQLAKERYDISQKQLEIDLRNGKVDAGNITKEAADAEIAYQNAIGQSQEKLAALDARRSAFLLEAQAEREKAIKKELELRKQLEDAIINNIADSREREIKESQLTFKRRIEAIEGNSRTERLLKEQLEIQGRNALLSINKKYDDQELKDQQKHNQDIINSANALFTQRQQNEIKNLDYEIDQERKNAQELLLVEGLTAKQKEDIRFESDTKLISLLKQRLKTESDLEDEALKTKLANENLLPFERLAIQEAYDQKRLENERNIANQINDINKKALDKSSEDYQKAIDERNKKTAKQVTDTASIVQQGVNILSSIQQIGLQNDLANNEKARQNALKAAGNDKAKADKINEKYDKLAEKRNKEFTKKDLTNKEISAIANTATGFTQALAQSGPLGIITGALVLAAGAVQIASIESQKSKLAAGGFLVGPSHENGGITGTGRFANVEVEGGEYVMNKKATKRFLPLLHHINTVAAPNRGAARSTKWYASGGVLNDGGFTARAAGSGSLDNSQQIEIMKGAIKDLQIVVGVKDIITGTQKRVDVIDMANVTK